MPNENELIVEYETASAIVKGTTTAADFYVDLAADYAAMRPDVDPGAAAMNWLNELLEREGHEEVIKALALQKLRSDAEAIQRLFRDVEGKPDLPEDERDSDMVAAGFSAICHKGGEIYPAMDFRV
jgi:hypothetical protein